MSKFGLEKRPANRPGSAYVRDEGEDLRHYRNNFGESDEENKERSEIARQEAQRESALS